MVQLFHASLGFPKYSVDYFNLIESFNDDISSFVPINLLFEREEKIATANLDINYISHFFEFYFHTFVPQIILNKYNSTNFRS
jgi:hypothetical protein